MKSHYIFIAFLLFSFFLKNASGLSLKSLECRVLDKTYLDSEYCYLKAVNRTYKYISLKIILHKKPIDTITARFGLRKRNNHQNMLNLQVDACEFLRNKNRNPLALLFYNSYVNYSNMNHTCPYDHDIIVEKLDTLAFEGQLARGLPLADGDYVVTSKWFAYNKPRIIVNIYFSKS